jgi:hypothetical protein
MLWISCGHTTPPLVRVSQDGYHYEVCGGRRCRSLIPRSGASTPTVRLIEVPFAPYAREGLGLVAA